jgi:hypothetical protein
MMYIYTIYDYTLSHILVHITVFTMVCIYMCVYIYILGPHFWGGKYHGETPPRYLATSWPR